MRIETLSNPGWSLRVDLVGTPAEGRVDSFQTLASITEWVDLASDGSELVVHCGAEGLILALESCRKFLGESSKRSDDPWSTINAVIDQFEFLETHEFARSENQVGQKMEISWKSRNGVESVTVIAEWGDPVLSIVTVVNHTSFREETLSDLGWDWRRLQRGEFLGPPSSAWKDQLGGMVTVVFLKRIIGDMSTINAE